jgi:hypothetical protein
MSGNPYSGELKNYDVPPYKQPKMKLLAFILSILYLIFICLPVFIFVNILIEVVFNSREIYRFVKKTIKYAKAKFEPKPTQGLP